MRLRPALAVAAATMAAAIAAAPAADAKRVRVFAVGPKLDLAWLDTRAHFHDKLFALADRGLRTPEAPLVQRSADDVASHLLGPTDRSRAAQTARDLVTFPEHLGFFTIFTGARGAAARSSQTLQQALAALSGAYSSEAQYYAQRFPQLAQRNPPTRLLALAATDTFGRVAVETFAELADRLDAYLTAGVTMAQSWRIVCASKATFVPRPGGARCDEESPVKVVRLRSRDEQSSDYAYEATDQPVAMTLVFDPYGSLVAKLVKSHLAPFELQGGLDLVPGAPSSAPAAVETPVGTLGVAAGRDALTASVTELLDQRHAELLVQPELHLNDLPRVPGFWAPDGLKAAGYSAALRAPAFGAMAMPALVGSVFDVSADAQQHFVVKPRSATRSPGGALIGQPRAPGFAAVAPYVVRDPLPGERSVAARRKRLADAAGRLPAASGVACPAPGEPGPCANGQVEGVIFGDAQVQQPRVLRRQRAQRRGPRTPFTLNRPVAPSRSPQRNVSLAARGRQVWAAFEERREGRDQVLLSRSGDDGTHWSRPVRPSGRGAGAANEWWPSVAVGPEGRVWVAWQDDSTGVPRVYVTSSGDSGRTFAEPAAVDASSPSSAQLRPSVAAGRPGRAVIAWVDERTRRRGEPSVPQSGIWAARVAAGGAAEPAVRLDQREPAGGGSIDNAWAPSVAARGFDVLVAYADSATGDWRIWSRASPDGGATWQAERPVNDTPPFAAPADNESLAEGPAAALTAGGPLVTFTDLRKHDSSRRPHELYDTLASAPGMRNLQVDGHGASQIVTFDPAIVGVPGGGAVVAWQDHGRGPGDIRAARVTPQAASRSASVRVDDTGDAGWNQWRPALTRTAARVVAAWEDERDGPAQIYAARARWSRIR